MSADPTRDGDGVERARGLDLRRFFVGAGLAVLPAVVLLGVRLLASPGAAGRFQAALAGMVAMVALGAFRGGGASDASVPPVPPADPPADPSAAVAARRDAGRRRLRSAPILRRLAAAAFLGALRAALLAALFAGAAYGVVAGDARGGTAVAFLYLGTAIAASGLAALGRSVGTPSVAAGAVAACVLWVGMTGLFWADPLAEQLDRRERRPFRQAVLHVDPALALAYDGAGFDRLRSDPVYFDVPLASSFYDRPTAGTTGTLWLATGIVAWGAALLLALRRERLGRGVPVA